MPHATDARPGTDKVRKCPAVARGAGGGPGRSWIQLKHYVRIQPKKISPWQIKWNWIGSMKFEKKRIHFVVTFFGLFSSKIFATMATWRNGFSSLATLKFWDNFQTYENQQIAQV